METAKESANECHEPDEQVEQEVAWDDVKNCKLDPANVREARVAEMDYLRRMKVYNKVPVQSREDLRGQMRIKVRWIDANKQDTANPK